MTVVPIGAVLPWRLGNELVCRYCFTSRCAQCAGRSRAGYCEHPCEWVTGPVPRQRKKL